MTYYFPDKLIYFVCTDKHYGYFYKSDVNNNFENWLAWIFGNTIFCDYKSLVDKNYELIDKIVKNKYSNLILDRQAVSFNMRRGAYEEYNL